MSPLEQIVQEGQHSQGLHLTIITGKPYFWGAGGTTVQNFGLSLNDGNAVDLSVKDSGGNTLLNSLTWSMPDATVLTIIPAVDATGAIVPGHSTLKSTNPAGGTALLTVTFAPPDGSKSQTGSMQVTITPATAPPPPLPGDTLTIVTGAPFTV